MFALELFLYTTCFLVIAGGNGTGRANILLNKKCHLVRVKGDHMERFIQSVLAIGDKRKVSPSMFLSQSVRLYIAQRIRISVASCNFVCYELNL